MSRPVRRPALPALVTGLLLALGRRPGRRAGGGTALRPGRRGGHRRAGDDVRAARRVHQRHRPDARHRLRACRPRRLPLLHGGVRQLLVRGGLGDAPRRHHDLPAEGHGAARPLLRPGPRHREGRQRGVPRTDRLRRRHRRPHHHAAGRRTPGLRADAGLHRARPSRRARAAGSGLAVRVHDRQDRPLPGPRGQRGDAARQAGRCRRGRLLLRQQRPREKLGRLRRRVGQRHGARGGTDGAARREGRRRPHILPGQGAGVHGPGSTGRGRLHLCPGPPRQAPHHAPGQFEHFPFAFRIERADGRAGEIRMPDRDEFVASDADLSNNSAAIKVDVTGAPAPRGASAPSCPICSPAVSPPPWPWAAAPCGCGAGPRPPAPPGRPDEPRPATLPRRRRHDLRPAGHRAGLRRHRQPGRDHGRHHRPLVVIVDPLAQIRLPGRAHPTTSGSPTSGGPISPTSP